MLGSVGSSFTKRLVEYGVLSLGGVMIGWGVHPLDLPLVGTGMLLIGMGYDLATTKTWRQLQLEIDATRNLEDGYYEIATLYRRKGKENT